MTCKQPIFQQEALLNLQEFVTNKKPFEVLGITEAEQKLCQVFSEEQDLLSATWDKRFDEEINILRKSSSKKNLASMICIVLGFTFSLSFVLEMIYALATFSWVALTLSFGAGAIGCLLLKTSNRLEIKIENETQEISKLYDYSCLEDDANKKLLEQVHKLLISSQASTGIKPLLVYLFKALKQNKGCRGFWKKIKASLKDMEVEYKHAQMEQDVESMSSKNTQLSIFKRTNFSI